MWVLIKREALGFSLKMLIVFFLFLGIGFTELHKLSQSPFEYQGQGNITHLYVKAFPQSPLRGFAGLLQVACIGLGISAAWVQFGQTNWRREWGFLLHRPIRRWKITLSKLIGAMAPLLVIPMLIWFFTWREAMQAPWWEYGMLQLLDGWMFALWGYAVYLATALTIMNKNKETWIVRGCLPMGVLLVTCIKLYAGTWPLSFVFMVWTGFMLLLVPQLFQCMEGREFS
jgi:hypothetical protein